MRVGFLKPQWDLLVGVCIVCLFLASCGGASEAGRSSDTVEGVTDSPVTQEDTSGETTIDQIGTYETTHDAYEAYEQTETDEFSGTETTQVPADVSSPVSEAAAEQMSEPSISSAALQSVWSGQIKGTAYNQPFSLPVEIGIGQPKLYETNPIGLYVIAGDMSQVGSFGLYSANEFATAAGSTPGQAVTLQYMNVEVQGSQIGAVLADQHRAEMAVINQFTGPNVSAQVAPPGAIEQLYQQIGVSSGSAELFAFSQGTQVAISISGNTMSGSVDGSGEGLIFPVNGVPYMADFTATRVR